MRSVYLTKGYVALVDDEDFERVSKHKWFYHSKYAWRMPPKTGKSRHRQSMHRFILGVTDRRVGIDHKNSCTLDNRKANLRLATKSQNGANRGPNKNNKSGYKGVYWWTIGARWVAAVKVNKELVHLGYFKDKHSAAKAYNEAALRYFGDFAKLNEVKE